MLNILDRYLLRSLLVNYLIALGVMLALYVALDLFVNMDEFTEVEGRPVLTVLGNIVSYYGPNLLLYFAQLSGVITLFACLATIARLRRNNELTAVLASGVSLYRVAAPVLAFGLLTTTLLVVDTEALIPSVAHLLARKHDDVDGNHAYEVLFLRDREDALLSAGRFHPMERDLRRLLVLRRNSEGEIVETIEADRATWMPPNEFGMGGRWRLERGRRIVRLPADRAGLGPRDVRHMEIVDEYESNLSPQAIQLRQAEGWIRYLSLGQLERLAEPGAPNRAAVIQTKHGRIAAPIVSMVLLLLGIPFFLDRSPANVLSDAGKCLVTCGLCFAVTFVAQSIRGDTPSALPAWIPIFIFATVAMILVDRIRT